MKAKFKIISVEKQLSPKQEDNVTCFEFRAMSAPLGKDNDFFVEAFKIWSQDHSSFAVGDECEVDIRLVLFGRKSVWKTA